MAPFNQKKLNQLDLDLEAASCGKEYNPALCDNLNCQIDEQEENKNLFLMGSNLFQLFCENGVKWREWP